MPGKNRDARPLAGPGAQENNRLGSAIGPEVSESLTAVQARKPRSEYSGSCSKKPRGRGMARESIALIEAMKDIAEAAQPINGRGIGYKLFVLGLTPSMSRSDMQRVYRLLKEAREREFIPWGWIVDETRELERTACWDDPEQY